MYIKAMFNEEGLYFYPPEMDNEESKSYKKVKHLAETGPFPLKEDVMGIQAAKYLKLIQQLGE